MVETISNAVVPNLTKEQIEQLQKDGYIVTNLGEKKEDEGEVICKMAINGKASKLRNVVVSMFDTLSGGGTSYSKAFDTQIKLTLMIEKVKDI
jgi:hypothetical protein